MNVNNVLEVSGKMVLRNQDNLELTAAFFLRRASLIVSLELFNVKIESRSSLFPREERSVRRTDTLLP